jgi:hypothetical protein
MNSRPPKEAQKKDLLALARRLGPKPLLIGVAAVHLGWWATLAETAVLLEEMAEEGLLREALAEELLEHGLQHGYVPV